MYGLLTRPLHSQKNTRIRSGAMEMFCHGGLRDDFVRSTVKASQYHDADAVVDAVNRLRHDLIWNNASPVWHRPQYWKEKMYRPRKILQVVGHTPVDKISRSQNVISCDTFSTYRDGRPIGSPFCSYTVKNEKMDFEPYILYGYTMQIFIFNRIGASCRHAYSAVRERGLP